MHKLIHVFGLRKSGNHAIINWIDNNAYLNNEGKVIHHNDIWVPAYKNPPRLFTPNEVTIKPDKPTTVILSYEDLPLRLLPHLPTVQGEKDIIQASDVKIRSIFIMRDPYNTFATMLKRRRDLIAEGKINDIDLETPWSEFIQTWKDYAKECLKQTNELGRDVIGIKYNTWFKDKSYRDAILVNELDYKQNLDNGIQIVAAPSGGSNWDKFEFQGRALEMKTLTRFKVFLDDVEYRSFFNDPEIYNLSKKIFGDIPGTERLHTSSEIESPGKSYHSLEGRRNYKYL